MQDKKKFEEPLVDSNTVEELSRKLLEANNKLHRAEQERKAMLENISHDLRAPLTAIRSTIDYLMLKNENGDMDVTDEGIKQMLGLVDSRARTLEVLVQDLYYLTCLESGREQMKFSPVPIEQLLEEYFFSVEMDEKYMNKQMLLNIPQSYTRTVNLDVEKMNRVLDNLFTNARKYSGDNAEIELGVKPESEKALFYVRDTGFGMKKDELERIFDRTYRVASARTPSSEPGSGLGLAIVKNIVDAHGGKIWCESVYGEGSTFYVEL